MHGETLKQIKGRSKLRLFLLFSTLFKTTFFSTLQKAQVFKYTQVTKKKIVQWLAVS